MMIMKSYKVYINYIYLTLVVTWCQLRIRIKNERMRVITCVLIVYIGGGGRLILLLIGLLFLLFNPLSIL